MKAIQAHLNMKQPFLDKLTSLWPAAKGSMALIRKPCIRSDCRACAEGRKHQAYILSVKEGNKRHCLYVPLEMVPIMKQAISNGRRIEQLMCRNGMELIRGYRLARKGRRIRNGEA